MPIMGDPSERDDPPDKIAPAPKKQRLDMETTPHNNTSFESSFPNETSTSSSNTDIPKQPEFYSLSALPPYLVVVESLEKAKPIHPMVLGGLLSKSGMEGIVPGGVRADGSRRTNVTFSTAKFANNFINSNILSSNKLKAYIPNYRLYKYGLIRRIPLELTDEDIIQNMQVPYSFGKVLKLRRLNRRTNVDGKVEWKPSTTILVTFEGQKLPENVYLYYNSINVDLYIPPSYICHKCLKYGHTHKKCTNSPRCAKCGESHQSNTCLMTETTSNCVNCKGNHMPTSNACPELHRQRDIRRIMATEGVSFVQASKKAIAPKKTFSEVVATSSTPKNSLSKVDITPSTSKKYTRKNIDHKTINSLLSYTNGQPLNQRNGCALLSETNDKTSVSPSPYQSSSRPTNNNISESPQNANNIKLMFQIFTYLLSNINDESVLIQMSSLLQDSSD